jgi:amidohydrolase
MLDQAQALAEQLTEWRRDFHAHPELGFREVRTANAITSVLNDIGLEVQTGVAKTGVVARLGEGHPVVAIRADMDALPIIEANDIPYASTNHGVMHACGHDAHSAILLGVARVLSANADSLPPGEIRFLFQPSEEAQDDELKSGGQRMVEEGALNGVDRVIALHVASDVEAGRIWVDDEYAMAASDSFQATITGTGGHGAYPDRVIDPVFITTQVLNAVYAIPSRWISPLRPRVISIGAIHAGETTNVIPAEVRLQGTIRSFDEETRRKLWSELERAFSVSRVFGGDYTLTINEGYPATYNDPSVAATIRGVVGDLLGPNALIDPIPGMGSEDFSYMVKAAPGAMFMLGAKYDETTRPHHTPVFNIDESVLPTGVAVLAETAIRLLREAAEE